MREPEYIKNKGLACLRLGGLSPVYQDYAGKPANKGLYAFIYPYFDYWFLSGEMSESKFPKNKNLPKHLCPKPKKFYADGEVLTKLDVPNAKDMLNGWLKTSTKELFNYLPKQFAQDLALYRQFSKNYERKNIYSKSASLSIAIDHYEIFVLASCKIK